MGIVSLIKRFALGPRATSEIYIRSLRKAGVRIGEDVTIHYPHRTTIDVTAPHLLTIGNHVNITGPATILTYDYSWSVVKGAYGEVLGNMKPVSIGDNVFIGWGATILCGTTIEANTIIGAHSVVSGALTGNSVWAGVPARYICSLQEYRDRRAALQVAEAKEYAERYYLRFGKVPPKEKMDNYFPIFSGSDYDECYENQIALMGTALLTKEKLSAAHRPYKDYASFLADCHFCQSTNPAW